MKKRAKQFLTNFDQKNDTNTYENWRLAYEAWEDILPSMKKLVVIMSFTIGLITIIGCGYNLYSEYKFNKNLEKVEIMISEPTR